jgi:hypothetical protein
MDFDVGFIDMPSASDRALAPIELLQQARGIVNRPTMNGYVINRDAALSHHLLKIAQTETIGQIPPDAQKYHRAIKMTAFEHLNLRSSLEV